MSNSQFQKVPEFSIVILCYQAGDYIRTFTREVIEHVSGLGVDFELILVANYWDDVGDDTPRIARELENINPHIKVVAFPKKGMMGWDMTSGLKAATGRVIAVIDGDGQMPPEDLVRVYKKLKGDNLNFVKTCRIKREDSFWRKVVSIAYNFIFHLLFPGLPIRDVNSKPKIFTREVYERMNLTSLDWFADAEIMIQVRRLHLKTGEVPTIFKKIDTRSSYVKPEAVWEFARNLVIARIKEFKGKH